MAIHSNHQAMLKESLPEMYLTAKYCIEFRKEDTQGCLGYPAILLLLAIADSLGSYIIDTNNVKKHFAILNHPDYYNIRLSDEDIEIIYSKYRNLLNHNAVLAGNVVLGIGNVEDSVYENKNDIAYLRLVPFLKATEKSLIKFLDKSDEVVTASKQLQNILKK